MMASRDVIDLYDQLESFGIPIWIDGGWGVDALLGRQTRPHEDLDIVIEEKEVRRLRGLLEAQGYKDVPRDDTSPWNFVLGDGHGHLIDLHVIDLDDKGNGLYGPAEKGLFYPTASLTGIGTIDRRAARCIAADF